MPDAGSAEDAHETFRRAVEALRSPLPRPEITVREIPAPQRLAPHSAAVSAEVTVHGEEVAWGRLIVLYDPEGTRDWPGPFRVVCQANSELESEIATDPLLGPVAWSWLTDALDAYGATHHTLSGTVTRATTEGFGTKADQGATTEVEMRASWTPESDDLTGHVQAWSALLASAAGLPPLDVTDITGKRSRP
ncbi:MULTISPECIES: DUF3000 domain-containing protein [Nocardiopsis]|uniref:DUF3000 domain-containing protein n=1 Tax=Nocardiopsis dassonvillei (strain ATCC 23218 / DSM 43111 / CIP 107115 / JCM 7437 / KCTC 9190 / NBRC 14626 / NCTC 10488 / NRRL B-5397 / IMRU 509) TaxID=446468 RepID=D7AZX2_NOCDD|nr:MULTISPECIES: DUF3000 domain-containing protein [Nocardiopsis]ADH68243.1 conserved hypothetical protein [Nocardiopsis dassonvillei subsp. dassonvillei DSM 43111]APC36354.1 hypothetical protein A9R04_17440 [Nocardiopsis dassonvillei]NKY78336.1 DUF3000 domain-containing protein [Nocardiopsis dassonvillei]VEI88747.1 Protein of uncharacterised function (DUF3000) [Nocardiopsis dassonvillei]